MTTRPQPRRRLGLAPVLATLLLATTLTACTDDSGPDPIPEADDTTSATTDTPSQDPSPTSSPSAEESSWENDYNPKQLATYERALAAWTNYETKEAVILEAAKATPEAKTLYEQTFPSPQWERYYDALVQSERLNIRFTGLPAVMWSRAARVKGQSVTIEQCVDYTTRNITQDGKKSPWPKYLRKPVVRTLILGQIEDRDWLVHQSDIPTKKAAKRCTGNESQ